MRLTGILILLFQGFQGMLRVSEAANLTAITWAHAVNSQDLLDITLASSIDMIEADIVLGHLVDDPDGPALPIMGHPPATVSDISLQSFLTQILEYNKNSEKMKGVKLDFKSTEVFNGSLGMLTNIWSSMDYPVWLNADIVSGPVNNTGTNPVDPNAFLSGCRSFPSSVLSIGWTTRWGPFFTEGVYTDDQIALMSDSIRNNAIPGSSHPITFPVRAGIAAQSLPQLASLMRTFNETNEVTLTIWSSENDAVDVEKLRTLIFSVGIDKVYVDVPKDLLDRLDLGNPSSASKKLFSFTLVGLVVVFVALFASQLHFI
uniref:Putative conserved secreted protein n=1 Tax=Phlebotomus kandelakii TaxID=1109342 RepID=A0A6B2E6H2_9DIPT